MCSATPPPRSRVSTSSASTTGGASSSIPGWCSPYRDRQKPAIVLSHNPDTADLAGWAGYQGWILSGHTHGGQCKPPFLPPPLLPVRNKRYTCGEVAVEGGRRLYISRGVGHTLMVRFNVRPEVTVFTLQPA